MNDLETTSDTVERVRRSVRRALELVGPGESGGEPIDDEDMPPAA